MKHITQALTEALDTLLDKQPAEERPHCVQRTADLYEAADEMGEWGALNPAPSRVRARIAGEVA